MVDIILGNDLPASFALTNQPDPNVAGTPAAGLTGVVIFLTSVLGGEPDTVGVNVAAVEESTIPGTYSVIILGSDIDTAFGAFKTGRAVWVVVRYGTHLRDSVRGRILRR